MHIYIYLFIFNHNYDAVQHTRSLKADIIFHDVNGSTLIISYFGDIWCLNWLIFNLASVAARSDFSLYLCLPAHLHMDAQQQLIGGGGGGMNGF